jgi:hypothetical protein
MNEPMKRVISSALVRLLRPLIMILLRNDIPYGTFADIAKWVYVDVAQKELKIPGRKLSISRVSIITGLSRKEVKRMKEISEPDDLGASERYNRAARVISGWLKDPRFINEKGDPRELPFEGGKVSFSSLVKHYSGDVPPRAIRDEMLRVGVVEQSDSVIRLLTRGYIVKQGDIEKLAIMGLDVGELITTVHHNITTDQSEAFLQRKVAYDNIPDDVLQEVRKMIFRRGKEFVESMDKQISHYDRDSNPSMDGAGKRGAGIGVFYFEK